MLLDATTGLVAASYYYDAFGNILEESGSVDNPIRYAGYQYDEETELYYLNARMYDSKIARFLQEDTYRGNRNDPLSLHLYAYVVHNPIRYWDPTGRTAVSVNINGATIEGTIIDGRTQVALRDIATQIGGTVEWDGKNTAILTLADGTQKFYDTTNTSRVMVNVRDFVNEVDPERTVNYTDTGSGTARVDISGKDTGTISERSSAQPSHSVDSSQSVITVEGNRAYLAKDTIIDVSGELGSAEISVYYGSSELGTKAVFGSEPNWNGTKVKGGKDKEVTGFDLRAIAQVSGLTLVGNAQLGNETFGLIALGEGNAFDAGVYGAATLRVDNGGEAGLRVGGELAMVSGKAGVGIHILGYGFVVGVEGSIGAIGAKAEIAVTNGQLQARAKLSAGLGGGIWFRIGKVK